MRNTKRELNPYSFYDTEGLARHFERMAAEGWAPDRVGLFIRYRRIKPQKLRFAITYYPDDGGADGEDVFLEYCAQAGWQQSAGVGDLTFWGNGAEGEGGGAEEGRAEEQDDGASTAPASGPAENGTDADLPPDAASAKKSHASHRGMDPADIEQKQAPENAKPSVGERFADTVNLDRSREQWKNAALEMGVQLDAYAKLWGVKGANLAMNLRAVTREKQDYREFLRKFARCAEQIRVNDDEFDYVYYCYGLERYGNLPLIEPLEYVEEKRIRDFVIAIDTSASTKDGLVRRFIEKTYAILEQETSFFADMNVLIVQCDAAVTDVAHIANLRDLDAYLDDLEIKGLGGTDFRPVFAYVDDAVERGELANLGGLIYFTDGQGTYPARKPDYDTAFVFVDDASAAASPHVPAWAMKVELDETVIVDDAPQAAGASHPR